MRNLFLLSAAFSLIIFYSCGKDKYIDQPDYDRQTSQDNSLAESTFSDIDNIAGEAITRGDSGLYTYRKMESEFSLLNVCAHVHLTPDSAGGPGGSIVVDFGNSTCYCKDKRYRKGMINITYTGPYRDSGTVITTTFDNYFVGRDDNNLFKIIGTRKVTNLGLNDSGNVVFQSLVDGQLINSSGQTMTWHSSRNKEWISGYSTYDIWEDDEYLITGGSSGTNFAGVTFETFITSPLVVKLNCRWITKGTLNLTPVGKSTRTMDYGNGNCDTNATVIVNGTTFPISLR